MRWTTSSLVVALIVFSSCTVRGFVPSATWLDTNDTWSPRDKFGFFCEADGSGNLNAYFFGGREATLTYRSDVYSYTTATGQWSQIYPATSLSPVAAMAFAKIGNNLWTFGGQTTANAGAGSTDALYALDLTLLEWRPVVATGSMPSPRRKMASWTVSNLLFIFGGLTGIGAINDVYSLDTTTSVWTKYSPAGGVAPSRRFDTFCTYYTPRASAICFGGTTDTGDSNEVWEFFAANSSWVYRSTSPSTNAPSARRLAIGALRGNELALWGGWDSDAGQYVVNTAMYFLDVTTWTWRSPVAQSLVAGDSGAMCSDGSTRLLLVGGNHNSGRSNDVWSITAAGVDTFSLVSNGGIRPVAREGHLLMNIGLDIFLLLGYDGTSYYSDVWTFNTLTTTWKQHSPTGTVPSARAYACGANRGALIFVLGGENAAGPLSEMFIYNTKTSEWRTLTVSGTTPGARSHHGCFFYSEELFIAGSGVTASGRDAKWFVYEIESQAWFSITPNTSTPAARQDFVAYSPLKSPTAYVALGIGTVTYNDRWLLSNLLKNNSAYVCQWTSLPVYLPPTGTTRQYIRGAPATILAGHHLLVCGGALSSSFPAALDNVCFLHDFNSGMSQPFPGAKVLTTGASAAYVGRRMYLFGGRLCSATVLRDIRVNLMQVVEFDVSMMCAANQVSDAQCLHCAPGSLNPTCTPVSAGYYAPSPWLAAQGCDPGSYSTGVGASDSHFCLKCALGTFTSSSGSSSCKACASVSGCPIGSTTNSTAVAATYTPLSDVQPASLGSLDVPWALIGIVIGALVMLFIIFFVYLRFISSLTVRNLDIFADGHRTGRVNQPFRTVATTYGGIFSVLYVLGSLALVATLVLAHFYDNIDEVKSGVPTPVIHQQFPDVIVDADLVFKVTIVGPLRSIGGVSVNGSSQCVVPGTASDCVGTVSFVSQPLSGSLQTKCTAFTDGSCMMMATCTSCSFETGQTTGVLVSFSGAFSAQSIRYTVSSTTGIKNPTVSTMGQVDMTNTAELLSSISGVVTPTSSATVFSGFPAVAVPIEVTPTYFATPRYISDTQSTLSSTYTDSGYHIESDVNHVVQGNTVDPLVFDQYYGVNVNFQLTTVASSVLLVRRSLKVSDSQFVSSLLGAVAGIISLTLVVINFFDKDGVKHFFKKRLSDTCPGLECCWIDLEELAHEEEEEIKEIRAERKAAHHVGPSSPSADGPAS